jgi:hypothetical protein
MKQFVLVRGDSERLYLYETKTWEFIQRNNQNHGFEFVVDNDDPKVLRQMQALVNKDIEVNK